MLEARKVSVRFNGLVALDTVDLTLEKGEILGLIGPNGSGKTTLLNVLSGFVKPATGTVRVDGRDVTGRPPLELSRLGVGRTFQSVRLFRGLTVLENVTLGALGRGASRQTAAVRARALLDQLGLIDRASLKAGTLPYGDQRTVALARTVASAPNYLLLDEPAAGLNDRESDELLATLTRLHRDSGFGIIIIEHDMRLLMTLCQRIHVLDGGKTLAVGSPEAIRSDPRVIEAYLGAPLEAA
ncbi:MAG TPA: ABC transporter ATP-binding protein [Bauldia sp.]|nr:ABC transporter ATP-binding protein [Bauldia sp.]